MRTKQVIVVRKDLKMKPGKLGAQVSHASMAFLTRNLKIMYDAQEVYFGDVTIEDGHAPEMSNWLDNFTKVLVAVNSEEEFDEIYEESVAAGLITHQVIDNGRTVFHGIPTKTCLAIGPHAAEKVDKITGHLPLY